MFHTQEGSLSLGKKKNLIELKANTSQNNVCIYKNPNKKQAKRQFELVE